MSEYTSRSELALEILPKILPMLGMAEFRAQAGEIKHILQETGNAVGGPGVSGHSGLNTLANVGMGVAGGVLGFGALSLKDAMDTQGAANQIIAAHQQVKQNREEFTTWIESNSTRLLTGQKELWTGIGASIEYNFGVKGTEAVTGGVAKMTKVLGGDFTTNIQNVTGILGALHVTAGQIPSTLDNLTAAASRSGQGSNFFSTGLARLLVQAQGVGASQSESLGIASELDKLGLGSRGVGAFGTLLQRLGKLQSTAGYGDLVNIGQFGIVGSLSNLFNAPNATPALLQKTLGGSISETLAQRLVQAGPQGASLGNTQGTLNSDFNQYLKSSTADLDKLKLSVQNLEDAFGKGLVPVVGAAAGELQPLIQGVTDLSEKFPDASKYILEGATALGLLSVGIKGVTAIYGPLWQTGEKVKTLLGEQAVVETESGAATERLTVTLEGLNAQLTALNERLPVTTPEAAALNTQITEMGTFAERADGLLVPLGVGITGIGDASAIAAPKVGDLALAESTLGEKAAISTELTDASTATRLMGNESAIAAPKLGLLATALGEVALAVFAIKTASDIVGGNTPNAPTEPILGGTDPFFPVNAGNGANDFPKFSSRFRNPGVNSWGAGAGKVPFTGGAFGSYYDPENNYQNRNILTQWDPKINSGFHEGTPASDAQRVSWYQKQLGGDGPFYDTDFPAARKGPEYFHFAGDKRAKYTFVSDGYDPNLPKGSNYYEIWKDPMGNKFMVWHADPRGMPTISTDVSKNYGPNNTLTPEKWTKLLPGMTVVGGQTVGASGTAGGEYHLCIVTNKEGRQDLMVLTGSQAIALKKGGAKVQQINDTGAPVGLPSGVAGHWSQIEQISAQTSVPAGVIASYMSIEDPGGSNSAVSPKGALGLMQVMPDAKLGGASYPGWDHSRKIGDRVYDLRDPMQNLLAGTLLIQSGEQKYGTDWMAIYKNVYNRGIANAPGGSAVLSRLQGYLNATNGGSGSLPPNGGGIPIPVPQKGGWWGSGAAPTTATGWASAFGSAASRDDQIIHDLFGSKIDPSKLSPEQRALLISVLNDRNYDLYQQTRSNINAEVPGGINSPAGRQFLAGAGARLAKQNANPLASLITNVMHGWVTDEQGQLSALKSKWSGVDPTTLSGSQQQQWLHDQYKIDLLNRQVKDNLARIAFETGSISKHTLDLKLAADRAEANHKNQAARQKLDGNLGARGAVVSERVTGRCAAEEHANVFRKSTDKNTKAAAAAGNRTATAAETTANLMKQLLHELRKNGKGSAQSTGGNLRGSGQKTVPGLGR